MALSQNPDLPPLTELEEKIRDTFHLAPLPGDRCFYCGEEVQHPCLYWEGEQRVWLHADCAAGPMRGLMTDLRNYIEWNNIGRRTA